MENWGAKQAGSWFVCWACWGSRGPGLCAQSEPGWILIRQQAAAERSEKSCQQIQISARDTGGRRPLSQVCLSNSSCLSSCHCLKNSLIVLFMPPILWFNSLKSEKFKRIKLLKHQPHSGQQQTPAISGVVASQGRGRGGRLLLPGPNFNCLSDGCRAPVRSVTWTQIHTARDDTYHRLSVVTPETKLYFFK